jgi:hypothetical protein
MSYETNLKIRLDNSSGMFRLAIKLFENLPSGLTSPSRAYCWRLFTGQTNILDDGDDGPEPRLL